MTSPHSDAARRPRLLLVDDNRSFRVVLTHMLMDEYEVAVAEDGQAALKLIEARRFDAVLTDVDMPGMDGAALASAMLAGGGLSGFTKTQRIRKVPPVIVVTGMADDDPRMKQLQYAPHIIAVMKKPVDYEVLRTTIEKVLSGDNLRPPMEQSAT